MSMDRRAFLTMVAGGWAVHAILPERQGIRGRIVGTSHQVGHLLREDATATATATPTTTATTTASTTATATTTATAMASGQAEVVIAGGGVSGLSAAWRLAAAGIESTVLELEPFVGGTSAFGTDGVVPYPWGAHYLAAPNPEARATLRLLQEIGTLKGWDAAGRPRFDARTLCHAPQERLFYRGHWHPGLVPTDALAAEEREEMARFADIERALTARTGPDGRAAFQIPLDLCSRDPELVALDRMSMAEWLDRERFRTPFLRWYVRYATLDDYGALPENVSAWAGLHYFAARKLQTRELEGSRFLVWPEGNGRLVQALLTASRARVVTGALVTRVLPSRAGVEVHYADAATRDVRRIGARAAIVATPAFITRRILPPDLHRALPERASSPWLVANLHVTRPIDPDLPWDSVLYDADGLGYVDARHQLTALSEQTVLTYYRAYGEADTAARRTALARAPWEELASGVLRDLAPAHPLLAEQIERMDLMLWGHGMPRPRPGFLGKTPFDAPCLLSEHIAWAHVDQAGMALFEEAQARGVKAAEAIAGALGKDPGETWL